MRGHPRHGRVGYHSSVLWTTCEPCGKRAYPSARVARRARRSAPDGVHMTAYPCPEATGSWHLGHLPARVRRGEGSKESYQQFVDERRARNSGGDQ